MSCLRISAVLLICSQLSKAFITPTNNALVIDRKVVHVNLFNFGKSNKIKESNEVPVAKVDQTKVDFLKGRLEKISNTQNRDYNAEAIARTPKKSDLPDKQIVSYNFGKMSEFPNLYKGWIKKDGDQIAKQMITSTKNSLKTEKYIEVLFDPVPNLVPDFATNRGANAVLEWSNIYWANRLVEGAGLKDVVALTLSGEGTKGQYLPTLKNNLRLLRLSDAKKTQLDGVKAFIVLSPCQDSHYNDAKALADKYGVPAIALNAGYSFRYDIGAGKPWTLAYVMKRIPKGWIYRQYPSDFQAVIEGPNYEIFKAKSFPSQPSLVEISKVSMEASAQKYGMAGNDRIFQNRL